MRLQIIDGHGFLIREYIRDYTQLPEDPYIHPEWSLRNTNTGSSSYGVTQNPLYPYTTPCIPINPYISQDDPYISLYKPDKGLRDSFWRPTRLFKQKMAYLRAVLKALVPLGKHFLKERWNHFCVYIRFLRLRLGFRVRV